MTTKEAIQAAVKKISDYLQPFGLTLSCNESPEQGNTTGLYEHGSVFSKDIEITIYPKVISKICREDPFQDKYSDPAVQTRITIYHEVGHAMMEQFIDWMESIPRISTLCDGEFGKRYVDIFEDYYDEENVVEDFA